MFYARVFSAVAAILLQPLLLGLTVSPVSAQDSTSAGKLAFNNSCRTCHVTDKGDNRLGPSLHAIVGRAAGALDNYRYSSALSSANFEWTEERLDSFISDPEAVVPGNKMKPFSGISDPDERRKIISYLKAKTVEAQNSNDDS